MAPGDALGCQEEGWLLHGDIGLDLGAPAGLEIPPGADVVTSPGLEGECGSGGKPGGSQGSSELVSRCSELPCDEQVQIHF